MEKKNKFTNIFHQSLQSGFSGAIATSINVMTLMWMRTTVNYQYRYGMNTTTAFKQLYREGGIRRFYRGVGPAMIQAPLARFGDTAANTGTIVALNSFEETANMPIWAKSACASAFASFFRVLIMPIDTLKTTLQVQGKDGISNLMIKFRNKGPSVFYHGTIASATATYVGHYPWFATYNALQVSIPKGETAFEQLVRTGMIGFASTCVSDTLSNSIRVVKVYRQSNMNVISYPETVNQIVKQDGVIGLFGRGLQTKLLSNGVQGIMFSVLWKYIDETLFSKK
jgi:hypothetical protein